MLESIAVPLQAIVWPLLGAAVILILRRFLPNWIRRSVAFVAALASLAVLWSLRTGPVDPVVLFWQPLNFFRMSPTLQPTGLGLFVGISLTAVTAAMVLGVRGTRPQQTSWHGLILVALAGTLLATMAANLLTLALGSGLLDLALIALALASSDGSDRVTWRMVVPGAASTLLLLFCTVQMDAKLGSASLTAPDFPVEVLLLMAGAGLLRMLIFPLHPRGLSKPEEAATLFVPLGTGLFLLARVQTIGPVLADRPWMLVVGGVALLAGGLLAWTASIRAAGIAEIWPGIAIHQAGYGLAFVLLLKTPVLWPLLSLVLALGILAVWWDSTTEKEPAPRPRWFEALVERTASWREQARSFVTTRAPSVERWRASWLGRHVAAVLPAVAVASLAGGPLTVGALGRWPLYAALLSRGEAGLLIAVLAADTFLAASLWRVLRLVLRESGSHRPKPGAWLSMLALAVLVMLVGIASRGFVDTLGLKPIARASVSTWGLGLIFVLPWLIGIWLARIRDELTHYLDYAQRALRLDWLFQAISVASKRLMGVFYWIGMVGEGEGWWGWALIVLAIGAVFFAAR